MAFAKRIFLFLALNILVITMISLVLNLLNVRPYITEYGLNYGSLMIFCLVWGMGGAFISLALSRKMAKWTMGVKRIDPHTRDTQEKELLDLVHHLSRNAGLSVMPEVGIYRSPEVNAFATGPTRNRSLVAVSSGLLNKMGAQEVRGVIAHEITHITNGDMVTMTLLQGVINAFVLFLSRILAYAFSGLGRSRDNSGHGGGSYMSFMLFTYLFEVVFMILGSLLVAAFSRYREYRADAGGAELAGKESMISALERLEALQGYQDPQPVAAVAALKISHPSKKGLFRLFATHPPLEDRIARLRAQ